MLYYLLILILAFISQNLSPRLYQKIGLWYLIIYIPILFIAVGYIYYENQSTFSLVLAIITFILGVILNIWGIKKVAKND
ncbi:hypothetical protein FP435_08115 [Lactobacillus sp. PV037]|uniref:hypothetical protein n=1 Tax=unclassified Lactobacillus TaxID=2620435 RepID=UPI00223ED618|nr:MULTISPECIES: hypothetical protein [unclassified Lactobacillus]QNQ81570.1 hypothetical protein FP433_00145 [Lactobacillus sp. PV012]QNQ84384.1 hypothetical protein FP435_08115 [Lactobacillus sp. PV037]